MSLLVSHGAVDGFWRWLLPSCVFVIFIISGGLFSCIKKSRKWLRRRYVQHSKVVPLEVVADASDGGPAQDSVVLSGSGDNREDPEDVGLRRIFNEIDASLTSSADGMISEQEF